MRDQVIDQPDVGSFALAEPTQHVRRRWIIGLTLASLGMWMATQTPLQVMLALTWKPCWPHGSPGALRWHGQQVMVGTAGETGLVLV